MAGTTSLSIIIGASVGAALAGIGSVQSSIQRLSLTTEVLKAKQATIGTALKGLSDTSHIQKLQKAYDDTGRSLLKLDEIRTRLTTRQARLDELSNQRAQLRQDFIGAAAMGATAVVPVKLAIDYESAMADVRKVVDFQSPDGFKKLSNDLLELTRTIPKTAVELAGIAASGGQLGVAEKDLKSFTTTIAKMSVAFDMSTEQAGDSMAKLANIYKIPITQIGKLGDAINELSNQSPAKASDIVTTLGRVGGVAKQFGLTELQTASLANAFIALGKPPEVAGTAINAMLTKLSTAEKGGKKFQGALREMGVSASELKNSIGKDAQGALVGFLSKLESIPAADRTGVLVDLFGLEYADDIAVLAGSMDQYRQSITAIEAIDPKTGKKRFDGSMDKEFTARSQTTIEQLRLFKNGLTELGINAGAAALPALNQLIGTLKPVVNGFADWAKANPKVVSGLVQLIAGVASAKVAFIGAKYSISALLSAKENIADFFDKMKEARIFLKEFASPLLSGGIKNIASNLSKFARIGFSGLISGLRSVGTAVLWLGRAMLMNPIGLTITAIAVAGLLIYRYWQPIKGFFAGVFTSLKSGFSTAQNSATSFANRLQQGFTQAKQKVSQFASESIKTLKSLPSRFMTAGQEMMQGLINGLKSKVASVLGAITDLGSSIKAKFTGMMQIQSPSRLFMGYGGHIGEGARLGVLNSIPKMQNTMQQFGKVLQLPKQAANDATFSAQLKQSNVALSNAQGGGHRGAIHFAPQITIHAGGQATQAIEQQVMQGLQTGYAEFERFMRRYEADRQRVAFG